MLNIIGLKGLKIDQKYIDGGVYMINTMETLKLPEGDFYSNVLKFTPEDRQALIAIYESWRTLCGNLSYVSARGVNLPEGLSESAFCLATGTWRITKSINGANSSMDCYDPMGKRGSNRIQVKACSVIPDLTSFGPNTEWDRIFFVDFYREGRWDGTFDIYELNTSDINNYPVNAYETVADQKKQNRRPRFSIYNGLIKCGRYIYKRTYSIYDAY